MDPQNLSQEVKGKLSTSIQSRVYSVAWRVVGRRQDSRLALDTHSRVVTEILQWQNGKDPKNKSAKL